jgi:hypothetical protein
LIAMAGRDGSMADPGDQDPIRKRALYQPNWTHGVRSQLQVLGSLRPEAQAAVARGETVWMPFEGLPPSVQSSLASGIGRFRFRDHTEAMQGLSGSMIGLGIAIEPHSPRHEWHLLLYTRRQKGGSAFQYGFPIAPLGVGDTQETKDGAPDVRPLPPGLVDALLRSAPWKEFADFQLAVADALAEPVASDYYHDKPAPRPETLKGSGSLAELMRRATLPSGYDWFTANRAHWFRNPAAAWDDLSEVPWTLENRLSREYSERGYLEVDSLAEVSQLNDQRIHRLETLIPGMAGIGQYRGILGWYRNLDARQRRQAQRPEGLIVARSKPGAVRMLTDSQGRPDPLLAGIVDWSRMTISIRQTVEAGLAQLVTDVRVPRGSWFRLRHDQSLKPGSNPRPRMIN